MSRRQGNRTWPHSLKRTKSSPNGLKNGSQRSFKVVFQLHAYLPEGRPNARVRGHPERRKNGVPSGARVPNHTMRSALRKSAIRQILSSDSRRLCTPVQARGQIEAGRGASTVDQSNSVKGWLTLEARSDQGASCPARAHPRAPSPASVLAARPRSGF
jgi:hypothetical protein